MYILEVTIQGDLEDLDVHFNFISYKSLDDK